jgi:23S rRNA (guanine745-N1)-methyltransferase
MITDKIGSITFDGMKFADLGCGECYYTAAIEKLYPNICIGGIDISKQSLIIGSRRKINASLAVASTFALPISDNYCDAVMSVFAPYSLDEVNRVLKNGGYFLRVYPLERHLMGLKSLIYDKPYLNDVDLSIPSGFELSERSIIKDKIKIENNSDIINLFMMTPYFYKTSRKDQEKIMAENKLETEIEFGIDILIKK